MLQLLSDSQEGDGKESSAGGSEGDDEADGEKEEEEEASVENPENSLPGGISTDNQTAAASPKHQIAESAAEYNPLIVRRSQRAIKPTKDVDLYLLGAKFGIDVEGSGADSSDLEFAPESVSDGEE